MVEVVYAVISTSYTNTSYGGLLVSSDFFETEKDSMEFFDKEKARIEKKIKEQKYPIISLYDIIRNKQLEIPNEPYLLVEDLASNYFCVGLYDGATKTEDDIYGNPMGFVFRLDTYGKAVAPDSNKSIK